MVVCKFFKEGYCRYGDRCRYEHSYQSKYSYHAPSSPSVHSPVYSSGSTLTHQQITAVAVDVSSAVAGKQWLLSSYGPFPFKKSVPGLHDVSPEEVRFAMYVAKANDTGEQAIAAYNSILQDAKAKFNKLIDPDPNMINVLSKIYNNETTHSPFGSQTTPHSIFGGQTCATNVFGGRNSSSNTVVSQSPTPQSVFGSPTTPQSVFAVKQSPQSAPSIFGEQSSASNAFGVQTSTLKAFSGQTGTSNVFGTQTSASNQNLAQSVFGGQATGQNLFSSQLSSPQSVFGDQSTPKSLFGSMNEFTQLNSPVTQNVFASKNIPSSVFGEQNKRQTVFSSAAPSNVFVSPQKAATPFQNTFPSTSTTNIFTQMPQNAFSQNQTAAHSVFGQLQTPFVSHTPLSNVSHSQQTPSPFGALLPTIQPNASPEGDFYSIINDLLPEDLEQYKHYSFEIGFVPELPPPLELCF